MRARFHHVAAGFLALFVLGASQAGAAVITFNTLVGWQGAAGAETWVVDFSGFAVDTEFRTAAVDAGPFSLDEIGGQVFRNLIDVTPVFFTDNNNTNHASMFTDSGATTVEMVFDSPVSAWGAGFFGALSGEKTDLVLNFVGGGSQLLQLPADGFFGFTSDTDVASITFQSRNSDGNLGGEGWGLDDVRGVGASTIPEPSTLLLLGAAGLGFAARRRNQRS